ncbi:MAG TPA: sensor histidine kinase KdpD, partial [Candidatus Faecousia faecavium]|nr:sensor histidine kinase KdpD [Candidatus Faecousia faecavium]
IVLGRTNHSASLFMKSKPLVDRLTSRMEDVDVYIIPDVQPLYKKKRALLRKPEQKFDWKDLGKSLLLTLAATGISFLFYELGLREANIIIVYLLGVLLTAVWTNGYFYGVLVSLLSVVSFNFFFTIPRFSLTALDPNYPVTFLVMMLASCLSCSLATRVKRQGRQSAQRAYYMELLMSSNQKMQQGQSEQEIIRIAAQQLQSLLGRPVLYALLEKDRQLRFHAVPASESEQTMGRLTAEELGVAEWVAKNDKHAGATTSTLSHAQNLYLSVRGNQEVMAVVGIPSKFYPPLDTFEKNLMIAMLDECGLILERRKLRAEKQAAEMETQREQLRANLLRAISHDLRTPLTAISGNAGMLMEKSVSLNENRKQEMYRSIYDDSMWLVNLTENLLSITRIENGTLPLRRDAEMIGDIFHEALSHVDRRAAEHEIRVELEDDMLMANMDARLIVQVIINIVNNAVKYTPEGSDICLSAKKENSMVRIEIADNGPGISDEAKQRLFDMFYTVNTGSAGADSRRGLGLGLSLCKSIVEAHGGSITVHDNQPHGSVFSFTLPLEEVKIQNV